MNNNNNILRITALAASAAALSAVLTGCGANEMESHSNIPQYDYVQSDEAVNGGFYYDYNYPSSNEEYKYVPESGFFDPKTDPLSTFSADVDTASYSNARRMLEDGQRVPVDAVRIEEFVNYFNYNYPDPKDGETFGQYIEFADCPWNSENKLMLLGIQGDRMDDTELPPSNLVFLIDSSGSMSSYDKLPLVQRAFSMLTEKLRPCDRVSIVTYAGSSATLIEGADSSKIEDINDALYSIIASGCTNGEGGIETAYKLAEKYFIEGGNNRVILATDGDLNVGKTSEEELTKLIEKKRDKGVYLSVLGFGTGNYKDARLEALADNGNGNYNYIDSVDEARKVLVTEMGGTLFTIAKDVKIQVEFNPSKVESYRLIGYDNRLMDAEDFYDNTKDAGEVGAGHSVTALYEVKLKEESGKYHGITLEFADEHEPAEPAEDNGRSELCKLSIAYKDVESGEDMVRSKLFGMEKYNAKPSAKIQLAAGAAEFGMLLKESEYKGDATFAQAYETVHGISEDESAIELAELIRTAKYLYE